VPCRYLVVVEQFVAVRRGTTIGGNPNFIRVNIRCLYPLRDTRSWCSPIWLSPHRERFHIFSPRLVHRLKLAGAAFVIGTSSSRPEAALASWMRAAPFGSPPVAVSERGRELAGDRRRVEADWTVSNLRKQDQVALNLLSADGHCLSGFGRMPCGEAKNP